MTCINCGNKTEGNFCNNCGQKTNTQRINFSYLVDEFSNSVLQVNRGALYTIKELFTHTGHSIREYLEGKRILLYRPLAFVLLVSAIYVLLTYYTGKNTYLGDAISGISSAVNDNEGVGRLTYVKILNSLAQNHAYTTLLLLPVFSLTSYLL